MAEKYDSREDVQRVESLWWCYPASDMEEQAGSPLVINSHRVSEWTQQVRSVQMFPHEGGLLAWPEGF